MLIAQQKRKENIAEYILYMWQVEDIIRAFKLDIDLIKSNIISRFEVDAATANSIEAWYVELMDMMRLEGVKEKGHLQINTNVVTELEHLNREMLADKSKVSYHAAFFAVTQDLLHLSQKSGVSEDLPITLAFNALYGLLTLRLQGTEISKETLDSTSRIQRVIALLAKKYHESAKETF